jgi:MFS family permease
VDFSVVALARSAPMGVLAIVTAGAAGGSVLALGALYATKTGLAPGFVGVFMVASLVGASLSQYPLGYLSDRFSRRRVVLGVAAGAVAIATATAVLRPTGVSLLVLVAAYGSLAFPMYSLAVSMVNDSMPTQKLVAVAAGVVFVYGVGSVIGPIVISVLMEVLGPDGYFWGLAGFFVPVVVYALARVLFTTRPRQGKFVSLPFRSSTAAAMLADPSNGERRAADSDSRTSPLGHGRR